ncbi:TIM barrel protein [Cohnella cellulosilytica]|uniref:TIM barrel protein n=1 Tax=Cohnella cellulosilytica TaxID=986710 RepID=A0ABW2FNV4_9BACL
MYRYSATQWIYGRESLARSLDRLKKYGYDGIELAGEPRTTDVEEVRRLLRERDMTCTSICGIYSSERDLSSSDRAVRSHAVQYVKDCVDLASETGAPLVIVVPSAVGRARPDSEKEEAWNHAVGSLREAGEYAASQGIELAIEALNRYETDLVNKLETAVRMIEEVGSGHVKLMADLFHMSIEERNVEQSFKRIAPYLVHVHIADNTREAAGMGRTDFGEVVRALRDIAYKGAITMEFLPPSANPYSAAERSGSDELMDEYTAMSIREIKKQVRLLAEA